MTHTTSKRIGRPASATLEQASPELADQLVDQSLRTIAKGSERSVEWRCPTFPDHIWSTRVYNRTNAKIHSGCPICDGRTVKVGFNDVATTHPHVAALMLDPALRTAVTGFSNRPVAFKCDNPNHDPWIAPVSRIARGSGCPQCSGRAVIVGVNDLATLRPDLVPQLVDPSLATQIKSKSARKVEWRCDKDPSHGTWWAKVSDRTIKNSGCPRCSGRIKTPGNNDLATTHPGLAAQLLDPSLATKIGKGHSEPVMWVCPNNPQHVWAAVPYNRIKGVGCPICANKKVQVGHNDLATTHPNLASRLVNPTDAQKVTAGTGHKLLWQCDVDPQHTWLATPTHLMGPRPTGCARCFNEHRSGPQTELIAILRKLLPDDEILTGDRAILGSLLELDAVIPRCQLAIEFNGVYWHSEAVLQSTGYHANKSQLAHDAGYRLIHVWEDDWTDKKPIVIRGLAHRLRANGRLLDVLPEADPMIAERLYARQLHVDTATGSEARAFWIENHLQGPVGSSYYVSLRDSNDRIRALLGIGPTNHGSRAHAVPGVWDIQRYATCGVIPGGFTRLLAHAEQKLRKQGESVTRWTSYSDDDISDGGMYRAAGFVAEKHQPPSYSYVGNLTHWTRMHRSQFTRGRFESDPSLRYEAGWTEHEAALANKLYRVYDAGKTRWVKDV